MKRATKPRIPEHRLKIYKLIFAPIILPIKLLLIFPIDSILNAVSEWRRDRNS